MNTRWLILPLSVFTLLVVWILSNELTARNCLKSSYIHRLIRYIPSPKTYDRSKNPTFRPLDAHLVGNCSEPPLIGASVNGSSDEVLNYVKKVVQDLEPLFLASPQKYQLPRPNVIIKGSLVTISLPPQGDSVDGFLLLKNDISQLRKYLVFYWLKQHSPDAQLELIQELTAAFEVILDMGSGGFLSDSYISQFFELDSQTDDMQIATQVYRDVLGVNGSLVIQKYLGLNPIKRLTFLKEFLVDFSNSTAIANSVDFHKMPLLSDQTI